MQLTDERKKRVIDLYFNQHKTYAEIAQIVRMSPRDIHAIVKEEESRRQKYQHQQQQEDMSSKAYKLFSQGKTPVEVAIALNLRELEATKYYREYWKLKQLHRLNSLYEEIGDDIRQVLELYRRARKEGLGIKQVVKLIQLAEEDNTLGLSYLEKWRKWCIEEIRDLDTQIEKSKKHLYSVNDEIASLKQLLNSYHISCERKRQESESLNNEISRLETLISRFNNNNEGYSKLKHIVKENVKAVLSENKQVISISFAALIKTLKADPEMANLIYNMSATPDGSRHDNNNDDNNISKYLELNKPRILDLSEKNYENIVEALTNNAIFNVGTSSNSTLSLLQSSATFSNPSSQSDACEIGKPETTNSKGDIAD